MARGLPDYTRFEFGSETLSIEDNALAEMQTAVSMGGIDTLAIATVAAGKALEIRHIFATDLTSNITHIYIGIQRAGTFIAIDRAIAPPAGQPITWTGNIWIQEGDHVEIIFAGTAAADVLAFAAFGKEVIRR